MEHDPPAYAATYNALPDLETSHTNLIALGNHVDRIHALLRVVERHDLGESLGLFLIHRHFTCPSSAVMYETDESTTERFVHVTRPVQGLDLAQAVPVRMKVLRTSSGTMGIAPLEFSTDKRLQEEFRKVAANELFLGELLEELESQDSLDLLGIQLVAGLPRFAPRNHIFSETTHPNLGASVTELVARAEIDVNKAKPTMWMLPPKLSERAALPEPPGLDRSKLPDTYGAQVASAFAHGENILLRGAPADFGQPGTLGGGDGGGGGGGSNGCCTERTLCTIICVEIFGVHTKPHYVQKIDHIGCV